MKSCLILVDLQNEFLGPNARFPAHESSRKFLNYIGPTVRAFRAANIPIFWVRSEYDSRKHEEFRSGESLLPFLSRTHTGRTPCCEKGSTGAEFPDEIKALIDESSGDVVITKSWYSALKETNLPDLLRDLDITDLYVGGLLTNVCVLATITDARQRGFDVTAIEDCLGWRNWENHLKSLSTMRDLGVRVLPSEEAIRLSVSGQAEKQAPASSTAPLPRLYYVNGSIPSWRVMMALYEKNIEFEAVRLKVMTQPKETRLPEFLAINHRGKTPVFIDVMLDSSPGSPPTTITINESLAILQYIETYHSPNHPLLPPLSNRVARALVLSRIQETENLHNTYDALEDAHFSAANAYPKRVLDDETRFQLVSSIHHELDYWEVYAGQTTYIAGNEFGLADCAFWPLLAYMVHRGFEWTRLGPRVDGGHAVIDAWPHLKAYFERVKDRGGEDGCAHKAQPQGWEKRGKADVWRLGQSIQRHRTT